MKDAGVKTYGSAREKFSSNNTSSTARAKPPPPPPPPSRKVSSNQRSAPGAQATAVPSGTTDSEEISWANLSDEDKRVFFTWLDEFFARYLGLPAPAAPIPSESPKITSTPSHRHSPSLPPRRTSSRASQDIPTDPPDVATPAHTNPGPVRRNLPPTLSQQGPVCTLLASVVIPFAELSQPKIKLSTKPSAPTSAPPLPNALTKPSYSAVSSSFSCSSVVLLTHTQLY